MSTPSTPLRRATALATLLALLVAQPVWARVMADASAPRSTTPAAPGAPAAPSPQAQDEGSVPCKALNQLARDDGDSPSFFAAPAPAAPAPKGAAPAAPEPKPCFVLRGLA
jgi:hypothetical protein